MSTMLDLFAPPPAKPRDNKQLAHLLAQTYSDAGLMVEQEAPQPEVDPSHFTGLYAPEDLLGSDSSDSTGWLVDIVEVERGMAAPTLPDASEFSRERLMRREEMGWLRDVDAVLIAPNDRDPQAQREQLGGFIQQLDAEASVVPAEFFPRKAIYSYEPSKVLGLDTETTGLDTRVRYGYDGTLLCNTKLVGVTVAPSAFKGYYLPVRNTGEDGVPNWDPGVVAWFLEELLLRFLCVFHNAAYDLEVMALNGVTRFRAFPYVVDTQILSYIFDINQPVHGLKAVSARLLQRQMIEIAQLFVGMGGIKKNAFIAFEYLQATQALVYACADSMNTLALFEYFKQQQGELNVFTAQSLQVSLDHATINVVRNMTRTGLPINYEYLYFATKDAIDRKIRLQANIDRIAGKPINVGSQPQLLELLFGQFGLQPLPGMKVGKTGKLSLDEQALAKLHAAYPDLEILNMIVLYRKISANIVKIYTKLITNSWVDAFQPWTRVKLSFSQTGTATGRFASSGNDGRHRVTVRKGKKKMLHTLRRGAWEAGVNAQGLPGGPFRTAPARKIKALPPGAGFDPSQPYAPEVEEEFLKACAEL